jgi:AcrR family transcriptional regulator
MSQVRREPRQQRSRERVERILKAATEIVGEGGINALSITEVSKRSDVPIPTVYRYFADRDEIAAAFLDRELEKIDQALAIAFLELDRVTVRAMVETAMFAHFRHHLANPRAVSAWFGGPRSPVVYRRIKQQDQKMAKWFRDAASSARLINMADLPHGEALLVELGDRTFEWVFSQSLSTDEQEEFVAAFVDMLASYLEKFATTAGLEGISGAEFMAAISGREVTG